jgi:hypothetical protein
MAARTIWRLAETDFMTSSCGWRAPGIPVKKGRAEKAITRREANCHPGIRSRTTYGSKTLGSGAKKRTAGRTSISSITLEQSALHCTHIFVNDPSTGEMGDDCGLQAPEKTGSPALGRAFRNGAEGAP